MKQGWEIKRLDDACEVEYGTRVVQKRDGGKIYPVYGGGGATFFMDTFNREDCLVVARFAMSAQCTRFVEGKFFLNDSGLTVRPKNNKELLPNFLNLQMFFLNDHIYSLSRGTAQRNLDVPAFRNIQIAFPKSIQEQQRIVSILNESFAAIAKAKANAEQNLKNAKELFESYLQGVFEKKGDGWEEKKLGDVASFSQGIQVGLEHHLTEPQEGYVRFIRIVDYTQDTDDIRYVPDPGRKYFVNENDIVMVRYGTPGLIGRGKTGVIANNLFKITIQREDLSNDFLCLCLSQKHIQTFLSTQGSATMPALNFGQLKNVIINFPPLKEQHTIVRQLDALRAETQKLEAVYQKKIADLEELKKSILQKAFAGELGSPEGAVYDSEAATPLALRWV